MGLGFVVGLGRTKMCVYQVIEVFSITIRSIKNGELRKDNETRIFKTFNQPGLASETLHYLPVMLMGGGT